MLKVPAFRSFSELGITAYQDDSMFWMFYLIPSHVSIRRDINNNPVFLLIKYAFSDQDREEDPALPRGGGYVAFDVEMSIPAQHKQQVTQVLQNDVDQIWHQLKAAAESQGHTVQGAGLSSFHYLNGVQTSASLSVGDVLLGLGPDRPEAPPGDRPPAVILSEPTWTDGKFRVYAPQSEALISHRIAEGPVSLVGNNVVSANLDLTSAGATFMEKTLADLDGGATDLTPIQVLYELKFWARVPPVKVRVTADSHSLFMAIKSIYHDYEDGCDDDSITHSEQQLQMAVQSGMIKIQIDAGTLQLDDDFLQEIRSMALKTVTDMIKEKFFDKKPAPENPEDDATKDFVTREGDVYYMKSDFDFESMHIEYNETIQNIIEWKIAPQGTLQTFLAGVPAEEMKKYVRVVDLEDDFFKTLGLTVTAFADWENEPIDFVEAQVRYSGRDENNRQVEKVETFTFTSDHTADTWDPSLIGNKRQYEYRWRVGFKGRGAGEFTRWEQDTTPHLNLSIAEAGKVAVQVLAGNIDFGQVTKQVQVDLSYADPGSNVLEESTTMVLNASAQDKLYQRYIYAGWDMPVRYRTRIFLKNDQMLESEWKDTFNRQLLINEPDSVKRLDVQLVPAGDWSGVVQSVVNLRYADSFNDYFLDTVFSLKSPEEFRTWSVVLKDLNKRRYEYMVTTSFKDGSPPARTAWLEAEGDQALPIVVKSAPRLNVKLVPNLVDFQMTPVVTATLRYDDQQGNVHKVDTFPFTSPTEMNWSFPITNDIQRKYRHQVTYNTADGQTIELPENITDETVLVLQKLLVPEVTCEVNPKLVNFVETPLVEVNVEYADRDHDLDCSDTLIFTDQNPQRFRFQVQKDSPSEYTITVTYYLADGRVVMREPATLDKTKIVIPRYVS